MKNGAFLALSIITLSLFSFESNAKPMKAVDAGPHVTYVVGSGDIDLNFRASTPDGSWTVTGGTLNGSNWRVDYSSFLEPFKDFTATLTFEGESDTKTIRAYNKLNPDLFTSTPSYKVCENLTLYLSKFEQIPALDSFFKEFYFQIDGRTDWVLFDSAIAGTTLGVGTHLIRERYYNIVNSFIFTDIETPITVTAQPELFWKDPLPILCTSDAPIDITNYLNQKPGVTISTNVGAAFDGTNFDPSVSGVGQWQFSAFKSVGGCTKTIGVVISVTDPCE